MDAMLPIGIIILIVFTGAQAKEDDISRRNLNGV